MVEDVEDIVIENIDEITDTIYKLSHNKDVDNNVLPSYCLVQEISNIYGLTEDEVIELAINNGYKIMSVGSDIDEIEKTLIIADKMCSADIVKNDYEKFYDTEVEVEEVKLDENFKEDLSLSEEALQEKIVYRGFDYDKTNIGAFFSGTKDGAECYSDDGRLFRYDILDSANLYKVKSSRIGVAKNKLYDKYTKEDVEKYSDFLIDKGKELDDFFALTEKDWKEVEKYDDVPDSYGAFTSFERICQVLMYLYLKDNYDGVKYTAEEDLYEPQYNIWNFNVIKDLGDTTKNDFKTKFGEKTLDDFIKASQLLKNKGLSTDFGQYLKMTKKEINDFILSLYDDKKDAQKKRIIQGTDREIRGKYEYLGNHSGYDIYKPLDYTASMYLGANTSLCKKYTSKGVEFYYLLDPKTGYGRYAIAKYPEDKKINIQQVVGDKYIQSTNFQIYNDKGKQDFSVIEKLPLDVIGNLSIKSYDIIDGLALSDDKKTLVFASRTIENIIIPNSITTISYHAFSWHTSLQSVTIPNSVKFIDDWAFAGCYSLKSINIPNSVTTIGDSAFDWCNSLQSVTIPNSVTSIGRDAFSNCPSLIIKTNSDSVVYYCRRNSLKYEFIETLEEASLTEKIVKKGNKWQVQSEKGRNMGTYNTKKEAEDRLKQVHYFKHMNENIDPETQEYINQGVLILNNEDKEDKSLEEKAEAHKELDSKLLLVEGTRYDRQAAKIISDSGLFDEETSAKIIDALFREDIHAFVHAPNWLEKYLKGIARMLVEESNGDKQRAQEFLTKCPQIFDKYLTWVKDNREKLGNSIDNEFINELHYSDVKSKLDKIQAELDKQSKDELSKMKFDGSNYKLIPINSYEEFHKLYGGSATGDGSSDRYAGGGGTAWCHANNKSVYKNWIQDGCKFFVLANNNWKNIPFDKNSNSNNPKDDYGNSLIAILVNRQGNLKNATLRCNHVGVTYNADNQYKTYAELSKVAGFNVEEEIKSNIGNIGDASILDIENGVLIECIDKDIESIIIPNSITEIGFHAFSDCKSLQSITIPNSVTKIGKYAFSNCSSLKSITIPNSVTKIDGFAFSYCSSLKSINIPNSVTYIGSSAFSHCTSLESITIPNSVTYISAGAFDYCTSLQSITIPNNITKIDGYAFSNCSSLKSINIPNSVTEIGVQAFDSCESLQSITIPNSVTKIGGDVFARCTLLKDVYYEGTKQNWNTIKISKWNDELLNANIHFNSRINESLEEKVEMHKELNPKLFKDNKLKEKIANKLETIALDFVDTLEQDNIKFTLKDIVIVGSNVNYNYTKDSDIDLHIIANSEDLNCPDNLYPTLYDLYKRLYNKDYDITIKGIPVEVYVELDQPQGVSGGIYSLFSGWLKEPVIQEVPEIDEKKFEKEFKKWEDKYFDIMAKYEHPLDEELF